MIDWKRREEDRISNTLIAAGDKSGRIRKAKYGILLLLAVSIFSAALHTGVTFAHQQILQQGIAEEVLRFHVLAESDSREDQEVKLKVRDAVLDWVSTELERRENIGMTASSENTDRKNGNKPAGESEWSKKTEMEQFLSSHLTQIEKVADEVLRQNGFSYRSTAKLERCYFPDRTYGDCTFPAGWYKALRICLGEAKGQNWWCVLYPKLCFSDCLHAVVDNGQMQELEKVLTVEEYESLLEQPKKWKIAFRWF